MNGKAVYEAEIQGLVAGRQAEATTDDALQQLIDRILLLQEGERLGLTPSKDEAEAAVKQSRASVEEPGGEELRAALEAHLKKNSIGWEEYWSSDTIRSIWRDTLTISRARESIKSAAKTPEEALTAVETRLAQLRSEATIERAP